jgi:hypothetical protein
MKFLSEEESKILSFYALNYNKVLLFKCEKESLTDAMKSKATILNCSVNMKNMSILASYPEIMNTLLDSLTKLKEFKNKVILKM